MEPAVIHFGGCGCVCVCIVDLFHLCRTDAFAIIWKSHFRVTWSGNDTVQRTYTLHMRKSFSQRKIVAFCITVVIN